MSRPTKIERFRGDYFFLSNFFPSPMEVNDPYLGRITVPTVEHGYQMSKCATLKGRRHILAAPTPGEAKTRGRMVSLVTGWEERKVDTMAVWLRRKFENAELRQKLLDTGEATLIEGNVWRDTFWGMCEGEGQNWLGRLLSELRAELSARPSRL